MKIFTSYLKLLYNWVQYLLLYLFILKQYGHLKRRRINLWGKILVACVPAAVLGILFDDFLDEHLYNAVVVAIALIVYGIVFIVLENMRKDKKEVKGQTINDITYKQAAKVGCFQVLALIPGTSRSGSTIIGGLLSGLNRSVITEFTFLVAIPVMAGASALKLLKYVLDFGLAFTGLEISILLVSCIVAFVVSMFVIKFMINYIKNHDFKVFGYYRIALGLLVLLYFLIIK